LQEASPIHWAFINIVKLKAISVVMFLII